VATSPSVPKRERGPPSNWPSDLLNLSFNFNPLALSTTSTHSTFNHLHQFHFPQLHPFSFLPFRSSLLRPSSLHLFTLSPFIASLIRSFTHSSPHSFTSSPFHPFIVSSFHRSLFLLLAHLLTHSPLHSLTSFTLSSFCRSLFLLLTHYTTHLLILSLPSRHHPSLILLFNLHVFISSQLHPFIHSRSQIFFLSPIISFTHIFFWSFHFFSGPTCCLKNSNFIGVMRKFIRLSIFIWFK
jgi:hypothetical protein